MNLWAQRRGARPQQLRLLQRGTKLKFSNMCGVYTHTRAYIYTRNNKQYLIYRISCGIYIHAYIRNNKQHNNTASGAVCLGEQHSRAFGEPSSAYPSVSGRYAGQIFFIYGQAHAMVRSQHPPARIILNIDGGRAGLVIFLLSRASVYKIFGVS